MAENRSTCLHYRFNCVIVAEIATRKRAKFDPAGKAAKANFGAEQDCHK